ncbi:endonuclease/exonuclease/phosphatase family protein [Paludibacterium yongneupense]|uniref:endonuclease/exonuclease/phosphatase family protein n=1 Tax=Paludibacterium yongneupense TaxID=400061 RepID=UPI0004072BAA|nr:endonuclease/exonuclease/phosphatase family protein [Paludibacterium yongneupense]
MRALTVASYNIHKGMSPLNRHLRLEEIACALETVLPDLAFLQEVQGRNLRRARRCSDWSSLPQHRYLARRLELMSVYGLNAAYEYGHHGNALLSRFPIHSWCNLDISVNRFESRGILHCVLHPAGWPTPVVALCAHFNLLGRDRSKQYQALTAYLTHASDAGIPLILAGDFNDWRVQASDQLARDLGLNEVFLMLHGEHALSFPARMPFLPLDRIYVRGLKPLRAEVLHGAPWARLSDHLPLVASLLPA